MKKGDRIRLSCKGKGKGYPLGTKKLKVKKGKRSLSLVGRLHDAKLRKGAVLEVRVTRPRHGRRDHALDDPGSEGRAQQVALPAAGQEEARPLLIVSAGGSG